METNVVVQLMTEEKRGEIDLENLWSGVLNELNRKNDKARADVETDAEQSIEQIGGTSDLSRESRFSKQEDTLIALGYYSNPPDLNQNAVQQLRA